MPYARTYEDLQDWGDIYAPVPFVLTDPSIDPLHTSSILTSRSLNHGAASRKRRVSQANEKSTKFEYLRLGKKIRC